MKSSTPARSDSLVIASKRDYLVNLTADCWVWRDEYRSGNIVPEYRVNRKTRFESGIRATVVRQLHRVFHHAYRQEGRLDIDPEVKPGDAHFPIALAKRESFSLWARALMERADKAPIQGQLKVAGLDMFDDPE